MMTLQRFHTRQDKSYNVRLMRAARRVVTPKGAAAYTAPVKRAWRRQIKRLRVGQTRIRPFLWLLGVGVTILAINAVISAIVIMLRRDAQEKQLADETPQALDDAGVPVEETATALA